MHALPLLLLALAAPAAGQSPVNPFPRQGQNPLVIEQVGVSGRTAQFTVANVTSKPRQFTAAGKTFSVEGGKTVTVEQPIPAEKPLARVTLEVVTEGFPTIRRTTFVANPEAAGDWIAVEGSKHGLGVRVARDGSMARIERDGRLVAVIAPLVHCGGDLPSLTAVRTDPLLRFQGDGIELTLAVVGYEINVSIDSRRPCEGPVVRPLGQMRQGLLAGVEYLSQGEKSSSTLDIETAEHLRFAPDPLKVTLPLMALVTDRASLAVTWSDMTLRPIFATPNFFDGTADHRMALRGRKIEATIRVSGESLEENILWAVKRRGLPPLPKPPRSTEEQRKLDIRGLTGPLHSKAGWGHTLGRPGRPSADMASTLWRLTGEVPQPAATELHGAHVANDCIFFVTGRAQQWLKMKQAEAARLLKQQQADGSFRYDGPYRRGHFEDTASGICARPAAELLEHAWLTGDAKSLAAGLRALDYMRRFCVPRGAQTWEVPLHTPDQLASAYLVWAYVRGYELTGNKRYLAEARRWAASGIPFVYLWSRYPIMLYAAPPVFGATNWTWNWIGLPVQWVGGVYAYALTKLAPYDPSFDWNHLARGILISAEQMQYTDGPSAGLLPDSFVLTSQHRNPADINPSAVVSLRLVLDGQLDSLAVAYHGRHWITAPFPVTIREGRAHIRARAGVKYQVVIDGRRVVDVVSRGDDVVPLD